MIPIYSAIEETDQLPLVDKDLIYINPGDIVFSYSDSKNYIMNLERDVRRQILLDYAFKESTCQPRFNLNSYFYSISTNPVLNILPNFEKSVSSDELFDLRAQQLWTESKKYDKTYIFWSGGIDSTLILCSVLKNWDDVKNLVIVLNQRSIDENPTMYENFIKNRLTVVNTDLFFDKQIKFSHDNLYVSGELGDPLITFDGYNNFIKIHSDILNKSWKSNFNQIINYFNHDNPILNGKYAFTHIIKSFSEANIYPVTVHDFLWWINFNWGWDVDLYLFLWSYHDIDYSLDMKRFVESNMFYYFNSVDCQNWAVNLIGTNETNKDGICKYPFKKYIYDFNQDSEYFKYKQKEFSTIRNPQMLRNKKIMAVDVDFNLYYREDYRIVPYY